MSLELEFGRIATALERIATVLEQGKGVVPPPVATPLVKPTVTSTPVSAEPPMVGGSPVSSVAPSDASQAEAEAIPTTPDQLLDLAKNLAAQLGEKVPSYTEWVRKTLAEKYKVTSQKLKEVPVARIPDVAREILAYAAKAGVKV